MEQASSRYQTQDKDRPPAFQGGPQWDVNIQAQLSREVSEALGFDYTLGRIDTSVHPFTGGSHPTDVRITTRYSQEKWLEGISGTVHEVWGESGHGLGGNGGSRVAWESGGQKPGHTFFLALSRVRLVMLFMSACSFPPSLPPSLPPPRSAMASTSKAGTLSNGICPPPALSPWGCTKARV